MAPAFSTFIFATLLGMGLVVLPGFALLRLCLPGRTLGFLSRVTIAPGLTVAICVVLFAWCETVGLKLGPALPWGLIAASGLSLFVRRQQGRWRLAYPTFRNFLARGTTDDWLAGALLVTILAVLLVVRFHSTRDWIVPPGVDSAQHTVIVQLLLDNHGLFQSWAPYSDAENFTYHFGFHAVAALFAWMSGSDAIFAVQVMSRVMGLCAVAALFALVRLWTRHAWGGLFAAILWELSSWELYFFDVAGRWTLLAGLTMLPSALVLLSLFLRPARPLRQWRLGLLCVATAAGLVLGQYKTALIFVALATALFFSRFITVLAGGKRPGQRATHICLRALLIVVGISLLVAPRLSAVSATVSGRHLKRVVVEGPPASTDLYAPPAKNALELFRTGFTNSKETFVSSLALLGVLAILARRRCALWFVAGWGLACVMMNPGLIGLDRVGVIDEAYWAYAVPAAIATMAGVGLGLFCDAIGKFKIPGWSGVPVAGALLLAGWAATRQPPLPEDVRFVLKEDLAVMSWIKANVPAHEKIAGRGGFYHGIVQGRDATMWLPYFTGHLTNHTLLAAALEKAPSLPREQAKLFTSELYRRDMSAPESALWMQEQGYRWFYSGANAPEILPATSPIHNEAEQKLSEQLARNPALELAGTGGAGRLYRVK